MEKQGAINMKEVKVNLPEIDGYEYTGEYRVPQIGERYLGEDGEVGWCLDMASKHHILRPVKWVPKVGEDYWVVSVHERTGAAYIAIYRREGPALPRQYFKTEEDAAMVANKINAVIAEAMQ